MEMVLSPRAKNFFPELQEQVKFVARVCQRADRDIRTNGLLVTARASTAKASLYSGRAVPAEGSICIDNQWWHHPDGKVHLTLGVETAFIDIARLVAHELRHIGQFHRCRKTTGSLGILMKRGDSEDDAYEFEDFILERIGVFA